MLRDVDHRSLLVTGYPDPWSVPAGGRLTIHLSATAPLDRVGLVSLDGGAVAGPWRLRATGASAQGRSLSQGSRLEVDAVDLAPFGALRGLAVEVLLTRNPRPGTILRVGDLRLVAQGPRLRLTLGARLVASLDAPERAWLRLSLDLEGDRPALAVEGGDRLAPVTVRTALPPGLEAQGGFVLGGGDTDATANVRVARPVLRLAEATLAWRLPPLLPPDLAIGSEGPEAVPLRVVNLPTFCVRSSRWDGTSFEPRLVPDHYDAVHLHVDDMGACDWPATHAVEVPPDAAPGVYALEVEAAGATERIPFVVRSASPAARLLVLLPTATYLAYLNEALPPERFPWVGDDRGHRFARDNGFLSLYDAHADRSGVSIASARRPLATLRDDYLYPLCGAPHGLPVDLRLLRFLRSNGIAFDLVTDHDLDREGDAALAGHAAVVTGSHPEYLSVGMEEALARFLAQGGSLAYLGGNGFAGAAAFRGDLMELRRGPAEVGRTWDGPLAEQALALTGEPGGHLRHRGRGEFALVGGAISLMGFGPSRPFRRTDEGRDPAVGWVFDGVAGDVFGTEGIVLGGAAGYEVDATDPHLGTHPDTVVLARADGFGPDFVHDAGRWHPGGEAEAQARRVAEMTLRPLPSGGWIFSAGSVAWCGALPGPGATSDVGRITLNVLRACAGTEP